MRKNNAITLLAVILAAMLLFTGCGGGNAGNAGGSDAGTAENNQTEPDQTTNEPIVAKLSHSLSTTSQYQAGAERFKELVEERTGGAIKIEIYPNNQLGAERECFEGQNLGTIEFALGTGAVLGQVCNIDSDIFSLPWLTSSEDDFFALMDSDLADEICAGSSAYGIEVMTAYNAGFRQLSNSKRPVNSIDDVKGLKIRCPESDMYIKTMEAIGISPTPLAWSDVFSSLQTGMIDGQETPVMVFCTNGLPEVQPYLAITNYMNDPILFTVSNSFMEKLTEEQREIVRAAAQESAEYERQYVRDNEQELLTQAIEDWGLEVTYPDVAPFQEAVKSVHESYKNQELLARVNEFLAAR